jgi:hypothetical protein
LFVLLAFSVIAPARAQTKPYDDPDASWMLATGDGCAIAVPRDWKSMDKFTPQVLIFRQSNGTDNIPTVDETGSTLQIQIIVEKIRMTPGLSDSANILAARLMNEPKIDVLERPNGQDMKLTDGNAAFFLSTELVKNGQHMLIMKLLTKSTEEEGFVVTGTIAAGKDSPIASGSSNLGRWLTAMVKSFVRDVSKFDPEKIKTAYKDRDKK